MRGLTGRKVVLAPLNSQITTASSSDEKSCPYSRGFLFYAPTSMVSFHLVFSRYMLRLCFQCVEWINCREATSSLGTRWVFQASQPHHDRLHDSSVWPAAGYHGQEEFSCQGRHIITKDCLPCGVFNARLMHDGTPDWVLQGLPEVYTLC